MEEELNVLIYVTDKSWFFFIDFIFLKLILTIKLTCLLI